MLTPLSVRRESMFLRAGMPLRGTRRSGCRSETFSPRPERIGEHFGQHLIERRLKLLPLVGPALFLGMPHGCHARGLFHDDNLVINVDDFDPIGSRRRRKRKLVHLDDFLRLESTSLVQAEIPVDLDMPLSHQPPGFIPAGFREPAAEGGQQRIASLLLAGMKDLSLIRFLWFRHSLHLSRCTRAERRAGPKRAPAPRAANLCSWG